MPPSDSLLAVKLPVDVRALWIGDLAASQPDDVAVFENTSVRVAEVAFAVAGKCDLE